MNRKRLSILRRALIAYDKRRGNLGFDLKSWASLPDQYRDHNALQAVKDAIAGKNYCGTTACACGLAATLPSFQRDGLRLAKSADLFFRVTIRYKGKDSGDAVMSFFDITEETLFHLFVLERYSARQAKNPLAVAKRIARVLESGEQDDYSEWEGWRPL